LGWACGVLALLSSVNLNTDLPVQLDLGLDGTCLCSRRAIALLAGAVVGIVPAVRLARANLNHILREGGRGVARGSSRFRDALVMVQVGSALMLLIIAALFTRSLAASEHANLGFNPANVLLFTMDPSEIGL